MGVITAIKKTRLYDFVAGTRARSAEVDDELNQLIVQQNATVDDLTMLNTESTANATAIANHKEATTLDHANGSVKLQHLDPAISAQTGVGLLSARLDIVESDIESLDTDVIALLVDSEEHAALLSLTNTIFDTTVNTTNVYEITLPGVTAMADILGKPFMIACSADATAASSVKVGAFDAYPVKKANGLDMVTFKNNGVYVVVWNGVNFQLLGEGGDYGNVSAADVRAGKTFGTDTGVQTGTLVNNGAVTYTPSRTADVSIDNGEHNSSKVLQFIVTAGSNRLYFNEKSVPITTSTHVLAIAWTALFKGSYRVAFSLTRSSGIVYGRIYVNGVAIGALRSVGTSTTQVFTEDIAGINVGDVIQLYAWQETTGTASAGSLDISIT